MGADLTVIIPAAGIGRRMKSHGAKPLIQLSTTDTILTRQIHLIKNCYPKAEIIIVVGFQADKIIKQLPPNVKVVENELYESTNVGRSIGLALRVASNPNILIIYGDLVFNSAIFTNITTGNSCVVVDSKNQINEEEVGVTIIDDNVTRFAYGLDTKWGHVLFLNGKELEIFKSIACNREKKRLNTFEILNTIIDNGGKIKAVEPKLMKIIEVNSLKDIELAQKI